MRSWLTRQSYGFMGCAGAYQIIESLSQDFRLFKAYGILERKQRRALQEGGWEGAFLCDALLRACAALGEVQLMLLTVHTMHALGIPVGYVAHGCVLTGLGRAGRLEVGHALQFIPDTLHQPCLPVAVPLTISAQRHLEATLSPDFLL